MTLHPCLPRQHVHEYPSTFDDSFRSQFHRTADKITDLCLLCQRPLVMFDPSDDICRMHFWAVITEASAHPSLPNASCMAAGGGERAHYHFGKEIADVRKFLQWSEGVMEEEQWGQCSVEAPCALTASAEASQHWLLLGEVFSLQHNFTWHLMPQSCYLLRDNQGSYSLYLLTYKALNTIG